MEIDIQRLDSDIAAAACQQIIRCRDNAKHVEEQISIIDIEQSRLQAMRNRAGRLRREARADMNAAINSHSQALCRPFIASLQGSLPQEVLDMVYRELLSLESARVDMLTEYVYECIENFKSEVHDDFYIYFIRAAFVGHDARARILDILFQQYFQDCQYDMGVQVLHYLSAVNLYNTGFKPLRSIRRLSLLWDSWSEPLRDPQLFQRPGYASAAESRIPWKDCCDFLLSVECKSKFQFHLTIVAGDIVGLRHLCHFLSTFRPAISALIEAGSQISMIFRSENQEVGYDLMTYYSAHSEEEWRANLLAEVEAEYFDSDSSWDHPTREEDEEGWY